MALVESRCSRCPGAPTESRGGVKPSSRRERVRAEATRMLSAGARGNVFPGGSACISFRDVDGQLQMVEAAGGLLEPLGAPARVESLYDVASLTKPVFATLCFRLAERGAISLDARVDEMLSDAKGTPAGPATLRQLLSHRGGVAAWGGLYLDVPSEPGSTATRRWFVSEALRRPSEAAKGHATYSDLGYMIAAEMVMRATKQDLPALLQSEIVGPLGITPTELVYPPAGPVTLDFKKRVAPTERDEWRGVMVRGEVHDENCAALGGISAHAGLFATCRAFGVFGRGVLDATTGRGGGWLGSATMRDALLPLPNGTHRVGWDSKSEHGSSAGNRMSPAAFGHLGFTGTSIWCDPVTDIVIVLLTNRVCPGRANERIKGFRPAFHDAIVHLITSSGG